MGSPWLLYWYPSERTQPTRADDRVPVALGLVADYHRSLAIVQRQPVLEADKSGSKQFHPCAAFVEYHGTSHSQNLDQGNMRL